MAYEFIPYARPSAGGESIHPGELKIAYGNDPPEDTSKLWVKTNNPTGVSLQHFKGEIIEIPSVLPHPFMCYCNSMICVDRTIYMISPKNANSTIATQKIYSYNIETGVFSTLNVTLPSAAYSSCCGEYNGYVYILGGVNSKDNWTSTIYRWDMTTGTVSTLTATVTMYGANMGSAVVGNKVYLFAGQTNNVFTACNTIRYFDMETETITSCAAKTPYKLGDYRAVVYNDKIYTFGGRYSDYTYSYVHHYDTETDTMSSVGNLWRSTYVGVHALIGSKIYVFGGQYMSSSRTVVNRTMHWYDVETNTRGSLLTNMPEFLVPGFITVDDTLYMFGGSVPGASYESSYLTRTTDMYKFSAKPEAPEGTLVIEVLEGNGKQVSLIESEEFKTYVPVYKVYKSNADGVCEPVEASIYQDGEWINI